VARVVVPKALREAFDHLQRIEEKLSADGGRLADLCQKLAEQQQRWMDED